MPIIGGIFLASGFVSRLTLLVIYALQLYPFLLPEEKELQESFGQEYDEYRRRVPRLILRSRA